MVGCVFRCEGLWGVRPAAPGGGAGAAGRGGSEPGVVVERCRRALGGCVDLLCLQLAALGDAALDEVAEP
jgi:hypothetical protein